jgi:hypothetical protein
MQPEKNIRKKCVYRGETPQQQNGKIYILTLIYVRERCLTSTDPLIDLLKRVIEKMILLEKFKASGWT